MNIVLFAWCQTATAYLDALAAAGAPPTLVVTGSRASATSPLSLRCDAQCIALLRCDDPNLTALVDRLRQRRPDLLLVAGCPRILRPALLSAFGLGALNFHPSLLPRYRGREPLFWALAAGETEVGITLHHLTEAIDGGPILLQKRVAVPPLATSTSLAIEVDRAGAALVPELLALARSGALPAGRVPAEAGSYFSPLRARHGAIDFTRSAAEIERLVRACSGEINAFCGFEGMKLIVLEAAVGPAVQAAPGSVHAVGEDAIVVGTGSRSIELRRWLFVSRPHAAAQLASRLGIVVGSRLDGARSPPDEVGRSQGR